MLGPRPHRFFPICSQEFATRPGTLPWPRRGPDAALGRPLTALAASLDQQNDRSTTPYPDVEATIYRTIHQGPIETCSRQRNLWLQDVAKTGDDQQNGHRPRELGI